MDVRRLGVLAGLLLAASGRAEDGYPVADPQLGALIEEALFRNPELRAARELHEAARQRIPQAAALADPMISVAYQNGGRGGVRPGRDDDTYLGVSVNQVFPYPGKRRLMSTVERHEADRAAMPLERARLMVTARVRRAHTDLLLARENLALIAEQKTAVEEIEALTRSRYAVGLAAQPDVLRAQAELARLEQMRVHEEGEEKRAEAALNRLLARPSGPIGTFRPLSQLGLDAFEPPVLDEILKRAETMSPELRARHLMTDRSRAAVDLARRNLKPDFVVTAGYLNRGAIPSMFSVEFGVVAPLRKGSRQKPAIAEAEARLRGEEADIETARLELRAASERRYAELAAAVGEARVYAKGVLSVDALAVDSALASYKTGKTPFVSVLEAHVTYYRDRWEYLELLAHILWHSADLYSFAHEEGE